MRDRTDELPVGLEMAIADKAESWGVAVRDVVLALLGLAAVLSNVVPGRPEGLVSPAAGAALMAAVTVLLVALIVRMLRAERALRALENRRDGVPAAMGAGGAAPEVVS